MPVEAIFAAVFFAMLFTLWVVLPSRLRRRHSETTTKPEDEV